MDFKFTPEEEAFRGEFTTWLDNNLPENWDTQYYHVFDDNDHLAGLHRGLQNKLFQAGYAGLHYPQKYGGQGRSLAEEVIVLETLASKCMELRLPGLVTFGMAGPTLLLFGNEDQKRTYIPKLLDGSHIWCQGFSEPNAGSDVVNISTWAEKKNGHYIVNGQKVWTSYAQMSDYCLLLARTQLGEKKHKGLTYLLLDMRLPGIEVRPITQITGEAEFNEIFLDDVKVPEEMLLGQEGKGWRVAITTLMFERVLGDAIMAELFLRGVRRLLETARQTKRSGRPVIDDPLFRQRVGQAYIEVMVLKYHGYRNLSQLLQGGIPGAEGSIGKLLWSEHYVRTCETAMQLLGPYGQILNESPWAIQHGMWSHLFLKSKGTTIAAGTSEIQRNIIGERVLGLPKDAVRASRT